MMSKIVIVHGVGKQYDGPRTVLEEWSAPLCDGVDFAGGPPLPPGSIECAFYGDLLRPHGDDGNDPFDLTARDVENGLEREMLFAMSDAALACSGSLEQRRGAKGRAPLSIQAALKIICKSKVCAQLIDCMLILSLKQVRMYFSDMSLRRAIQSRLDDVIETDCLILIGHSLGSVVAYEWLCANPRSPVRTLVTLGSPLGIPNLIFHRLVPVPIGGIGAWPGSILRWSNVADQGDLVAMVKSLSPLFGGKVRDFLVHNGGHSHDVRPYLTARETGSAIASGIVDGVET